MFIILKLSDNKEKTYLKAVTFASFLIISNIYNENLYNDNLYKKNSKLLACFLTNTVDISTSSQSTSLLLLLKLC